MNSQVLPDEEIARLGLEIYNRDLKPRLEPSRNGEQVAICVEDGDYEVAPDGVEADRRLRQRHPDAVFVLVEVGKPVGDFPWIRLDAPAGKA
jgi:hypothetical protein